MIQFRLRFLILAIAFLPIFSRLSLAQMEKRKDGHYDHQLFLASEPKIGEQAPNIKLLNFDSQRIELDSFRGQNIILVKAGYT